MRVGRRSVSPAASAVLVVLIAAALPTIFSPASFCQGDGTAPRASSPTPAPAPSTTKEAGGDEGAFVALDVPEWVVVHTPAAAKDSPWILIVDDPQCPFCMQLMLAIEKARETGDTEITRALLATLPFPLTFHDQAAHIVEDAFCLEAGKKGRPWSAASYLDWLIVEPWKSEPAWRTATIDDIGRDGGMFDSKYDAHRVTSSRRRDFQTAVAKTESACAPGGCAGDADCEKLCDDARRCRAACPAAAPAPSEGGAPGAAAEAAGGGASPPASPEKCLADCVSSFVSKRYRQFSKAHSACLLEEGPGSAHARVAAAFAWAVAHKIPGTPTIFAGHPSIGFRALGDSDNLAAAIAKLHEALAETRHRLQSAASPGGPAGAPSPH